MPSNTMSLLAIKTMPLGETLYGQIKPFNIFFVETLDLARLNSRTMCQLSSTAVATLCQQAFHFEKKTIKKQANIKL